MNLKYTIIYRNERGRFKTNEVLGIQPQIGHFITIKGNLYIINYIEIIPRKFPDYINKYTISADSLQEIILYCTEQRDFRNNKKPHWLEDINEIKEEK